MLIKPCVVCGEEFDAELPQRADGITRSKRFCSIACKNRHRTKEAPPPEFFWKACELCGVEFDATPSRPKYVQPVKYCKPCRHKGRGLSLRRQVQKTCEQCGKTFEIPQSWDRERNGKHTGRFCSRPCSWESQRQKPRAWGKNAKHRGTGRWVDPDGYIRIYSPNHPTVLERIKKNNSRPRKWIGEHRLVMEQVLGRILLDTENVHHLDGNRQNNDPANLEVWITQQPSGQRVADLIAYIVEYHRPAVEAALLSRS